MIPGPFQVPSSRFLENIRHRGQLEPEPQLCATCTGGCLTVTHTIFTPSWKISQEILRSAWACGLLDEVSPEESDDADEQATKAGEHSTSVTPCFPCIFRH
ncbi:hypothetical protein A0H81_05016 [Grifola frondosa]|uniref:Uncharacterized protein n=1 Tax=Grifola frondosa TaxID=5627 RepID=A0A1C7MFC1_GRIFR|nr:hypothetical protein A0H81_05016 [Grifola frondosa]